jgi:hypothetical protein
MNNKKMLLLVTTGLLLALLALLVLKTYMGNHQPVSLEEISIPEGTALSHEDYIEILTEINDNISLFDKKEGIYKCIPESSFRINFNGEASLNHYKSCSEEGTFLLLIGKDFGHEDEGRKVYQFKSKKIAEIIKKYEK